ncbi:hypothetical protein GCM10022243_31150 [Saccharothrix violaceirubra]|uniref:Undecaprenyl-diphosphatase n=1 Tax=Saccharothrix violaceirubra TaxID=413306 RepID=A0A7W7WWU8_9PSEU|nr:phosphatase PAP2 family protein [Saccharothrix violaceirubra]MBB4966740.1 undecaprenyl-diphosphatase [Saccharothrix violaceirubra]
MTRLIRVADSGSGLYDGIIGFARATPGWFQGLGELYTEVGLLLFGVFFLVAWWRARATGRVRAVTRALLAPVVTVGAYVSSELLKLVIHEDRPCRGLPVDAIIAECPEIGDWSFPSNHSAIAGAAAVGLAVAWRRVLPWVVAIALLMAFSRVFVGVHYPHDVLVGLLFGAGVALVSIKALEKRAFSLVGKLGARRDFVGRLLFAVPPVGEEPTRRLPRQRDLGRPGDRGAIDGPTLREPRQGGGR